MNRRQFIKNSLIAGSGIFISKKATACFAPILDPLKAVTTSTSTGSCGQSTGTLVLGSDSTSGSVVVISEGYIRASRFQAQYSCPMSNMYIRVTNGFSSNESITVGIYGDTGNRIANTTAINGNSSYSGFKSVSITTTNLTQNNYYWIAVHASSNVQVEYNVPGDTDLRYKEFTTESYSSGNMPANLDFSTGFVADRAYHFYGVV